LSASPDANSRRIVAEGMRNPFRFTFRPGINRLPKADDATVDNFGWPCYEGVGRTAGYEGTNLNLCKQLYNTPGSVTSRSSPTPTAPWWCRRGLQRIRRLLDLRARLLPGRQLPRRLLGRALLRRLLATLRLGDVRKRRPARSLDPAELPATSTPSTSDCGVASRPPHRLVEIGPGGDLFVVDFTGSVRRFSYPGSNRAPTAVATAQPQSGPVPLTVNFDGTGSSDPDAGDSLTYAWDLDGDGQFDDSTAAKPTWTCNSAAAVTVRLRVTDKGASRAPARS
jgi:hypothetical protein